MAVHGGVAEDRDRVALGIVGGNGLVAEVRRLIVVPVDAIGAGVAPWVFLGGAVRFFLVVAQFAELALGLLGLGRDRKSTRLNSSHQIISYAVFCLKKKNQACCSRLRHCRSSVLVV